MIKSAMIISRAQKYVPARRLGDIHHISHECKAIQFHLRDVRLEQNVNLCGRLIDAFLDWDWYSFQELGQLELLFLPNLQARQL